MAELADALDLGSSEATRTGSIPARCTSQSINGLRPFFIIYLFIYFVASCLFIKNKGI